VTSPADVLAFWRAAGPKKWFAKDDGFDADIRARFLPTYAAAAAGRLTDWETTPEGALALTIVLDQFPRNMFRDSARAFATDAIARAIASCVSMLPSAQPPPWISSTIGPSPPRSAR
jgi:uncharacterized protein (DUF924 family)